MPDGRDYRVVMLRCSQWFSGGATRADRVQEAVMSLMVVASAVLSFLTIWALVPMALLLVAYEHQRRGRLARRAGVDAPRGEAGPSST